MSTDDTNHPLISVDHEGVSCPHCGYDVRGITQPVCPECGRGFDVDAVRARVLRYWPHRRRYLWLSALPAAWLLVFIAALNMFADVLERFDRPYATALLMVLPLQLVATTAAFAAVRLRSYRPRIFGAWLTSFLLLVMLVEFSVVLLAII